MDDTQLVDSIRELGLSEKEARVYLACLKLGSATVQDIAKLADVKRVTTYVILESLQKSGLVGRIAVGKKTLITAESPRQLEVVLKRRLQELERQRLSASRLVPRLESAMAMPEEAPTVHLYHGDDDVRLAVVDFVERAAGTFNLLAVCDFDASNVVREVIAGTTGIDARVIFEFGEKQNVTSGQGVELRRIAHNEGQALGDVLVAGESVLLVTWGDRPNAVAISDAKVAATHTRLFEMAWDKTAGH